MKLSTIRNGSRGTLVETWQAFLRGLNLYKGPVDGDFGPGTDAATRAFQRKNQISPVDGVVGSRTWGQAMALGLSVVPSDTPADSTKGPNWPLPPPDLRPLGAPGRARVFGTFEFSPAPTKGNPEGIKITSKADKFKVTRIKLPDLKNVEGLPGSGVFFHVLAAEQLQALTAAWAREGVAKRIISWAGSYVPRFIRGSRTTLSSHAWGSAFDINAPWNSLGRVPALTGERGSVRELVEIANQHGFYWGGHFKRPDGMHFECVKLL